MTVVHEVFLDSLRILTDQNIDIFLPRGVDATLKQIAERMPTGDIDILVMPEYVDYCVTVIQRELEKREYICVVRRLAKGCLLRAIPFDLTRHECHDFHVVGYVSMILTYAQRVVPGYSRKITLNELPSEVVDVQGIPIHEPTEQLGFILNYLQWLKKKNDRYHRLVKDAERSQRIKAWIMTVVDNSSILPSQNQEITLDSQYALRLLVDDLVGRESFSRLIERHWSCVVRAISVRWRSGVLVFFSGPDGAGKTTCLVEIIKRLDRLNVKYESIYSLQVGTIAIRRKMKSIRARLRGERFQTREESRFTTRVEGRDRDTGKRSWWVRRALGLLIGLLDICIFGRLKLLECRLRGKLALVETAPLDIFVKRHRPRISFFELIFGRLVPRSNIAFLLIASPQRIVERKPELTTEEITDYYRRMNELTSRYSKKSYASIKTDIELNDTVRILSSRILSLWK